MKDNKFLKIFNIIYILVGLLIFGYHIYNYSIAMGIITLLALLFIFGFSYKFALKPKNESEASTIRYYLVLTMTLLFLILLAVLNVTSRHQTIGDIKVLFPWENDFIEKYNNSYDTNFVEYYYKKCSISIHLSNYDKNKSNYDNLIASTKQDSKMTNEITKKELYDMKKDIEKKTINNKEWDYFEVSIPKLIYKVYYTNINNNFYYIEVENFNKDNDDTICSSKLEETLSTIKYK